MSDTTQNNNTTNNENNSSLTAAEIARIAVEQMYNLAMGAISAGSALIDNKIASTTMTFWSGGFDLFKNQVTNPNDNHYQGIGRAVGDMLNLAITFWIQEKFNKVTVSGKTKAEVAFGTYFELANINLGEKFSNLFNTYVANADRFYDEIITNDDFFNKVKNGLINNGLMNFVDYFDPDGDGNVSAIDIVNGYQKLFSPPPAFGTMDFEIQFASNKPKEIIIKADISKQEEEKEIIQAVMKHDEIQTLTINSQTYNIKELSNLELRNAIENIPQVSFLLSRILIKVGEYLDLGEKGIYKVKSGDTLSTIAQKNGMVTKDLVRLNSWLCDEGRIKFNQNKVLIKGNPLNLSNTNHTLYGEANAENVLTDANGGDNEFIGGSKKDIMQSKGKGYDIYHANDGDEITDNDGKGEVKFGGTALTGGLYNKDKGYYESEDESIEYHLNGNTLIVKNGSESITINNYSKSDESLGIKLLEPTEVSIVIQNGSAKEQDDKNQSTTFDVTLNGELKEGEFVEIQITGNNNSQDQDTLPQIIRFEYGQDTTQQYTFYWDGNEEKNPNGDLEFSVSGIVVAKFETIKVTDIQDGIITINDDDKDDEPNDDAPNESDSPNDTFPDTDPASTKTSPIVIDLNGDGVKTISRKNNKTYFDLDNNKFAENTSWIDKNDGILINKTLITDNNITNGSELFGNHTLLKDGSLADNGFEALKEFVNLNLLVA